MTAASIEPSATRPHSADTSPNRTSVNVEPISQKRTFEGTGQDRAAWRHYRQACSDRELLSEDMNGKTVLEHALLKAVRCEIDPRQAERFARALERYEVLR